MRQEEKSRLNTVAALNIERYGTSFLPRESIYKCTMKAKADPLVLVLKIYIVVC
jgi:hypothetical protein